MTYFIGDVHGKFEPYKKLIKEHKDTIQVGDMGIGFKNRFGGFTENPPYDHMVRANARFIRGNHDNPGVCRNNTQWLADGLIEGDMMFIGGAFSIDKDWRTNGIDWWDDEQLSYSEFFELMKVYEDAKPKIMVTHDCPYNIIPYIHGSHHYDNSATQQCLQNMFELHQPDVWIHGHHHISMDHKIEGTRFICLAELEIKEP